jgi:hypothetical protein
LDVRKDNDREYHLYGKKKVLVGKKEVDGVYFASAVTQKNFVGFYFFPIYTHQKELGELPEKLSKCLKGKSCFHIKDTDAALFSEIESVLRKGCKVYEKSNWI